MVAYFLGLKSKQTQITSDTRFKGQGKTTDNSHKNGQTEKQMLAFTSHLRLLS